MIDMEYMNKKKRREYDDDMIALSVICNHHMHNFSTFNYNKIITTAATAAITKCEMQNAKWMLDRKREY